MLKTSMESHGITTFLRKRSVPKKSLARTCFLAKKPSVPPPSGGRNNFGTHFRKKGGKRTAGRPLGRPHSLVGSQPLSSILVRGRGLEPPWDCSHMPLKHARLPVSTPAHRF